MTVSNNKTALKRQVTMLKRRLEAQAEMLAVVAKERDEAVSLFAEKEASRQHWIKLAGENDRKAKDAEQDLSEARIAQQNAENRAREAEDELVRQRAYIDGMMAGMYPPAPQLPWKAPSGHPRRRNWENGE